MKRYGDGNTIICFRLVTEWSVYSPIVWKPKFFLLTDWFFGCAALVIIIIIINAVDISRVTVFSYYENYIYVADLITCHWCTLGSVQVYGRVVTSPGRWSGPRSADQSEWALKRQEQKWDIFRGEREVLQLQYVYFDSNSAFNILM